MDHRFVGCASAVLLAALIMTACAKTVNVVTTPAAPSPPPARLHAVIPLPQSIAIGRGPVFTITADTQIIVLPGDDLRVARIARALSELIGISASANAPRVQTGGGMIPPGSIVLALDAPAAGAEGYDLSITPERATISASQPAGLFYGVQTLRQLLPAFVEFRGVRPDPSRRVTAPSALIVDRPRFPWRGAMLDVARHFLTVDEVKRYVDLMALYKLNRLHLHLADDQGWRIEIASWPALTTRGGSTQVGGGPGGFYTRAQYTDLVQYAANRFVTIVPEIDMPGHTNAALASYAELNCDGTARDLYTGTNVGFSALCVDREITYTFIDDVVREIAAMTPGAYFHVGGDEVKTLTPEQYSAFVSRVLRIVESHGKQVIGWDEIGAADLTASSLVQHWRPKTSPAAAVARGAHVVLSTADRMYLDMKYDRQTPIGLTWAGVIDARDAYDWEPSTLLADVPEASLIGVEAPLWSETVTSIRDVEYLAFPRLAGIAEVGWSRADGRVWDEFKARLGAQTPRWTALGVNFYRSPQVDWK